jgi:hypothetical protein
MACCSMVSMYRFAIIGAKGSPWQHHLSAHRMCHRIQNKVVRTHDKVHNPVLKIP